jgi:hypothetical protein
VRSGGKGPLTVDGACEHYLLGHETCLGNPYNLKFWAIGEKSANMFVAELGNNMEMERVMAGTPWIL